MRSHTVVYIHALGYSLFHQIERKIKAFQQELFASIAKDAVTVVTVDLPNQTVTNEATGHSEKFDINSYKKYCLMNGYDDIDYLLSQTDKIEAFENKK